MKTNMKMWMVCFCVAALALSTSVASAGMIGNVIDLDASAILGTTINTIGSSTATVSAVLPEFAVCVGPIATITCASGMLGGVDITDDKFEFNFSGSTIPSGVGFFLLQFSGFTDQIVGVTNTGGSLSNGIFDVAGFDDHSITFFGFTQNNFNATGGKTITFDVDVADVTAVPEPQPTAFLLALVGLGMLVLGWRVTAAR